MLTILVVSVPEPLLTRTLSSAFDEILTNSLDESLLGPPSLRTASAQLISDLQQLIWKLPDENRSVLHELCRLLRRTADHSATTKMPLSNLVLVFCPTLNMNPSLLSLLVETQDDIFGPVQLADTTISDTQSEASADQTTSEESEREARRPRPTPLLHQRSISDMKLLHLTEMSRRNGSFGRLPPVSLAPIVVPISVSASASSSTPSTSISTSYTSSEAPSLNTAESSAPTSPQQTVQAAFWGRQAGKMHAHKGSLPLPVALSHAFVDPFSSSTPPVSSSIPFKDQRERQGSTATLSTLDEGYDGVQQRSRTPSTLRALGALLTARSRSNTSISIGPSEIGAGSIGTPTTPTNRHGSKWSPASNGGGRLSRRSSSFFPGTPKPDKLDWGFGSGSPGGSLPSRSRKGSVGNLKALVSAPLEATREEDKEKTRPPHLSMIIPGGGTGEFLTSPISSLTPSSPTPTATFAAPLPPSVPPPTFKRPSDTTNIPNHSRAVSNSTITGNKRWSTASGSSKRWSGTGSTATARSNKRASWSEQLQPPSWLVAPAQVDSTPALGSVGLGSSPYFGTLASPTTGPGVLGAASGSSSDVRPGARSGTPIADMFSASSSSVDLASSSPSHLTSGSGSPQSAAYSTASTSTSVLQDVFNSADASASGGGSTSVIQRRRSGILPALASISISSPLHSPSLETPRSNNSLRPLPTPPSPSPRIHAPPSSFPAAGVGGGNAGHVQSAIAALTQVQQQQVAAAAASSSSSSKMHGSTLTVGGSDGDSASLPPRMSFNAVRKKQWSRTAAVSVNMASGASGSGSSTGAGAASGVSASTSGASPGVEDNWASSVLAQMTAGAAGVETPLATTASMNPLSLPVPAPAFGRPLTPSDDTGTRSSSGSESAEPPMQPGLANASEGIIGASDIPDGTVRDARRRFELNGAGSGAGVGVGVGFGPRGERRPSILPAPATVDANS